MCLIVRIVPGTPTPAIARWMIHDVMIQKDIGRSEPRCKRQKSQVVRVRYYYVEAYRHYTKSHRTQTSEVRGLQ